MTMQSDVAYISAYGPAMCFVDRVIGYDAACGKIAAEKTYSPDDPMIEAHSLATGNVVPGVFLVEQAAQTALAYMMLTHAASGVKPRLVNVRADWSRPAPLRVPISAHVAVRPAGAGTSSFTASLSAGDGTLARVRGVVAFMSDPDA